MWRVFFSLGFWGIKWQIFNISQYTSSRSINIRKYILQDRCATDNIASTLGSSISLRNGQATATYESTDQVYRLTNTVSYSQSGISITPLTGQTNFIIEFDSRHLADTNTTNQSIGITAYDTRDEWEGICVYPVSRSYWVSTKHNGVYSESETRFSKKANALEWVHNKYIITPQTINVIVTNANNEEMVNYTHSFTNSSLIKGSTMYLFNLSWVSSYVDVKNIIVY